MSRRLRGLCRMCGERYDPAKGSVDIYERRDSKPSYAELLHSLLSLNPVKGDNKPDRLGSMCAKLLDDWQAFRDRCEATQSLLRERCLQARERLATANASSAAASASQPSTSRAGTENEAGSSRTDAEPHGSSLFEFSPALDPPSEPANKEAQKRKYLLSDDSDSDSDSPPVSKKHRSDEK